MPGLFLERTAHGGARRFLSDGGELFASLSARVSKMNEEARVWGMLASSLGQHELMEEIEIAQKQGVNLLHSVFAGNLVRAVFAGNLVRALADCRKR